MDELVRNIVERRTIRKYQPEQIREDLLEQILQAGLFAPNAGGNQSPVIIVCQSEEINERLGRVNRATFPGNPTGRLFGAKEQPSIADDASIQSAFYGAPTVLTLFAPKDVYNFTLDCAVAAENIMVAAHALGIGSCLVARARETFQSQYGRALLAEWGIQDNYEPKLHIVLGYPAGTYPQPKPRREGRIVRIP